MTNTKARDEWINKRYDWQGKPEDENFKRLLREGYDKAIEHVLKAVGEFGSFDEHSIRNFASRELTFFPGEYSREKVFEHKMEAATIGARHQHAQIIKKIKGETK